MANTTNYNWETPDDTDLVKDGAAAIRTLGNSVDTTTKALNPETTLGDIAYRSATSNTNTRLAIGSAGQVLTVAAGVPSWASPSDQTPLTTKGDVFTFSTVDARLGVGANGTVLTADSAEATGLKWAAPAAPSFVGVSAFDSNVLGQSISNTTYTALTYDSENYDTDSFHSTSSNTSRLTIPSGKGGKYQINAYVNWDNNATGRRIFVLYKNGVYNKQLANETSSGYLAQTGAYVVNLVATDYIEIFAYQDSGGTRNCDENKYFQATFLGA